MGEVKSKLNSSNRNFTLGNSPPTKMNDCIVAGSVKNVSIIRWREVQVNLPLQKSACLSFVGAYFKDPVLEF